MVVKFTRQEVQNIVGKQDVDTFNKDANESLKNAAIILKYYMAGFKQAPVREVAVK